MEIKDLNQARNWAHKHLDKPHTHILVDETGNITCLSDVDQMAAIHEGVTKAGVKAYLVKGKLPAKPDDTQPAAAESQTEKPEIKDDGIK